MASHERKYMLAQKITTLINFSLNEETVLLFIINDFGQKDLSYTIGLGLSQESSMNKNSRLIKGQGSA